MRYDRSWPRAPVDAPGLNGRLRGGAVVHRCEATDRTRPWADVGVWKSRLSPDTSNCDPVGLKQPTVSSVATSAITIGIGGPRHLSLFGARRRARRY